MLLLWEVDGDTGIHCMCINVVRSKPGDVGFAVFLRSCVATEQPVLQQISKFITDLPAISFCSLELASSTVMPSI